MLMHADASGRGVDVEHKENAMKTLWTPSPNHSGREGARVDTILIHHTAGHGFEGDVAWLCNPESGLSSHYVIGRKGEVAQLVKEDRAAWHAGKGRLPWDTCEAYNFNRRSMGVELVNLGDGMQPFTEEQYRALGELLGDLVHSLEWSTARVRSGAPLVITSLPGVHGYILGHRDVAMPLGRKTDPADNFDWGRVRSALTGGGA